MGTNVNNFTQAAPSSTSQGDKDRERQPSAVQRCS